MLDQADPNHLTNECVCVFILLPGVLCGAELLDEGQLNVLLCSK